MTQETPDLPFIGVNDQVEALQMLLILSASYIVNIDPQFQGRHPQEVIKWLAMHLENESMPNQN